MTTTARAYADRLTKLDNQRQAAYRYISVGRVYAGADTMRRKCANDTDAIAKNLTAINLIAGIPDSTLEETDRVVATGIAAQAAITAIRSVTRTEVQAMTLTDLAALLSDTDAHPIEREIAADNLHDRYMRRIGVDAYNARLDAWINNSTPDHETMAMMFTELGAD